MYMKKQKKMMTIGVIFLFFQMNLGIQNGLEKDDGLVVVKKGENVTVTCHYQSDMAMHFSWYKHKLGQKPDLLSTIYKYDIDPTFYGEFRNNARFKMVNGKGITHLIITDLQPSDSATYYCGSAHSNIVEFGEGTELIVKASQVHSQSVLQPPLQLVHPGDSVTLQCTVFRESCSEDHTVYWFRRESGESHPGIIYTHENRYDRCKKSSETDSPTQSCVYKLPKNNLNLSDAGTYYCAVVMCGEILFGNGTKLDIKGVGCSEHIKVLVLLSIVRSLLLLCSVTAIIYCCIRKRANAQRSDSLSGNSKKKYTLPFALPAFVRFD